MRRREFRGTVMPGILSVAALFILWWSVTRLELVPALFVPSPGKVFETFIEVALRGYRGVTLFRHLAWSMYRVLSGFLLAMVTAVPLGLLMGRSRAVKAFFDPLIEMYRPLPPLAYYTLLIVWMGIGDASKIALLFLAAFPPLSISTMAAVQRIPAHRIESAMCLGVRGWKLVRKVVFPSTLPGIFTGLRVSIGFTYTTLVSSEIVAATNGIGWLVLDAGRFLRTDLMFVGIITMALTGYLLDRLIRGLESLLIPWKED